VLIVRLNVFVEDEPLLPVTLTAKLAVPAEVGVPLSKPLLLKPSPDGTLPDATAQL
jgi:hypothetical protein